MQLDGQYGIHGVYLSLPTIINRDGAKEIVEIKLAADEEEALRKSASVLKPFYEQLV